MSTLTSIILVLFILWVLGFFTFHIAGSLIHILLIIAVIMVLLRIIFGKKIF